MEGGNSNQYKKGLWTVEEDQILMDYVKVHGKGQWNRLAKKTGLKRCGKSCRLRWMNYLSPTVKRGSFSEEEEDLIIRLHKLLGNRWSLIAGRVPGRTDNQVKNYWNAHLSKKIGVKKKRNAKVGASDETNSSAEQPPPMGKELKEEKQAMEIMGKEKTSQQAQEAVVVVTDEGYSNDNSFNWVPVPLPGDGNASFTQFWSDCPFDFLWNLGL